MLRVRLGSVSSQDKLGDSPANADVDVVLAQNESPDMWLNAMLEMINRVANSETTPVALRLGDCDFQLARSGAVSL